MHLPERRSVFNFYESFSDLIFNALVLFLVLILFLSMNVNRVASELTENKRVVEAQKKELEKGTGELQRSKKLIEAQAKELQHATAELQRLVGANRFSGVFGESTIYFAVDARKDGQPRFYFAPYFLISARTTKPTGISAQEHASSIDRFWSAMLPAWQSHTPERFAILLSAISQYRVGSLDPKGANEVRSISVNTQQAFSLIASGFEADEQGRYAAEDVKDVENLAEKFGRGHFFLEFVQPLRNKSPSTSPLAVDRQPVFRFGISPHTEMVIVGGQEFNSVEIVQFLLATGGAGLIIEYVPVPGGPPQVPPWFVEKVMEISGFVNRVPTATVHDNHEEGVAREKGS